MIEKEKISANLTISSEFLSDINYNILEDFINDALTIQLTRYIYSNLAEERELNYYFERPTFLDWLLRRRRKATFNLKVKDLLLNPPESDNTRRIYVVD